ncbi:MAG: hypothetical protein OJI67_06645 [Prosthecobacter sp.]|nr:hypothetical protein [Prosthecobacter sp.]
MKHQDGNFPQVKPLGFKGTLAQFWASIPAKQKPRSNKRVPRPRLLDPVPRPENFGETASEDKASATRGLTRRSLNRTVEERRHEFGVIRPLARPQENETPARAAAGSALASISRDGNSEGPATGTRCNKQVALDEK